MKSNYRILTTYVWFSILCLAFVGCADNKTKPIISEKRVVWSANENDNEGYRIPGIVVSAKGTVLAFSEERPEFHDDAPKSIVAKRSLDNGKSWSESIYIEKSDGSYWNRNSEKIHPMDTKDKKEVWTNIAPIIDTSTGRIFFFYSLSEGAIAGQNVQRYTKVFYKYSDDDGQTWSDRQEITHIINVNKEGLPNRDESGNAIVDKNGFPCDFLGRAFHMPGPGHGIQLSTGRLLLQIWSRTALGTLNNGRIPINERQYGVSTIYSDDHGKTWNFGSAFGHNDRMNESRMAELANGDVMINSRYVSTDQRNNHRLTAISHDGGITWTDPKIDRNFPLSNPCDAGLLSVKDKTLLVYSKNESLNGRKNLVVRLSKDNGASWPYSKVVDTRSAWYSDMALLQDGNVVLIYETGKNSPVYCVSFKPEWIMHNDN